MSNYSLPSLLQMCLVFVVVLCILIPHDVTGNPMTLTNGKRGSSRRYPRARYRVGYIFGKRSSSVQTSSKLFDVISRKLISRADLKALMQEDPAILRQAVSFLDKDDDGYITVADFL